MCRGKAECSEFGPRESWDRYAPLPPPVWIAEDIHRLAEAAHRAAAGEVAAARHIVGELRAAEAMEWFVEHAQISAHQRRRVLSVPRPPEVSGNRRPTPEAVRHLVWQRDFYTCRYCGLPTITPAAIKTVRKLIGEDLLPWGSTNATKHGTLFAARAEYDHVVPVSLGGGNTPDNIVTSCPGCNYGKDRWSVEELGIEDPRARRPVVSGWDGLMSLLSVPLPASSAYNRVVRDAAPRRRQPILPYTSAPSLTGRGTSDRGDAVVAFLADVRRRVPARLARVEFDRILNALIEWSCEPVRQLVPRAPGDQNTVSYGCAATSLVLWAAYPRQSDGAKVAVLPGLYSRLPQRHREALAGAMGEVHGEIAVSPSSALQLPMHLLATDAPLDAFTRLLDTALTLARSHQPLGAASRSDP
jgi:5-methylcytosine-specific restriction endonuclease McrA